METNWRLRADARMVDIGKRDLVVQLETGPCQSTAAPATLNENGGLIDHIIISSDEPFAAPRHQTIPQKLSSIVVIFCHYLCAVGCTSEPGGPGNQRFLESKQSG
jgi:hypothetical protein